MTSMRSRILGTFALLGALACGGSGGGSSPRDAMAPALPVLAHQPPAGAGLSFLLTDGTVMVQGGGLSDWYKLRPDLQGSYLNGTWTKLASLPAGYAPDAFASAVLGDGRLVVVGGEYNQGAFVLTNLGAVYDPVADAWTALAPPTGWTYIGDAPSVVLPDGRFLVGRKLDQSVAALDPVTLQWTLLDSMGKADFNSEEGWTLLPDGSVLTVDVLNAPVAERYLPGSQQWISAGTTPVNLREPYTGPGIVYGPGLVYHPPGEVGPAVLRPDGTVFATGAGAGHTAVYHPGATLMDPGTWTAGPTFPGDEAGDASAVLLPSGRVLVMANSNRLYEFDGTSLLPGPQLTDNFGHFLLTLPTGQVLVTGGLVQIYTGVGAPDPSWAPAISACPSTLTRGSSYAISGTQFNGLSQAAGYGDELETATNYPLVRITMASSGHVFYARTHDHSTMGVATGSAPVSTTFDVPAGMETGAASLVVVANGIPSAAVPVTVN